MIKHFATIIDENKTSENKVSNVVTNLIGHIHCALMHIKTVVHTQNNVNIESSKKYPRFLDDPIYVYK